MTDPGCVFCAIVAGGEAERVWEDEATVAFLDRRPVFRGHTLVVPRRHVVTLDELDPEGLEPFFATVRRLSLAVEAGLGAGGTFVAINNRVSQSVPHLHCHVIPRTKGDGLRGFFWPRTTYADGAEAADYARRVAEAAALTGPRHDSANVAARAITAGSAGPRVTSQRPPLRSGPGGPE